MPNAQMIGWMLQLMLPQTGTQSTAPNSGPSKDSGAALCMTSEYNGSVLPKRGLLY